MLGNLSRGAIEITNLETSFAPVGSRRVNRYHPYLRLLEEAEAQIHFRRLVPLDRVGWDTPIYKIKRHPRFSIEELEKD